MRLGLGPIPLAGATRARLQALATAAAGASFDSIWVEEARDECGGGMAAAAMLAQMVPIRVGAVLDIAGFHPLYVAEDIAVADMASGGRTEVVLRGGTDEQVRLLVDALSGAHLRFDGAEYRVPARLDANQPSPQSLALNPSTAQPAVPIWIHGRHAAAWPAIPDASGSWPPMVMCRPTNVEPADLLRAAGGRALYVLMAADSPKEVAEAGRRFAGPLRMPEFPDWVNA